jgi:hypothetical protein
MPGTYDHAGTLFALGLRLTKLDATGAPLVGANNCYVTDSLITIGANLTYTDNSPVVQNNGRGAPCVAYTAANTLTNAIIDPLQVCTPDPNILGFLLGGAVILTPSEVQTVTITGAPTGGTFTLTFSGQTTSAIAYNATATAVATALNALSNVGTGTVTVTGGPGPATPYVVTFGGQYAGTDVAAMTATGSFTGGTTPAIAVTTSTPGGTGNAIGWRAPLVNTNPTPNGVAVEAFANAIIDNAQAAVLPYWAFIWPRVRFTLSSAFTLAADNVSIPEFAGVAEQNQNFGDGPVGDIAISTDRVFQMVRVATEPTAGGPAFITVV